jgi:hypothetical protein
MRSYFILAIGTASLMSSVALAQTVEPKAGPIATTVTATTTTVTTSKWMTEQATGQSSKLIGLNLYNSVNEKIGGAYNSRQYCAEWKDVSNEFESFRAHLSPSPLR